jgi:hypothetical protein
LYRIGLVLPVLFLAAGCAAIDKAPYPRDWPASVRQGASCQSVSGVYENRAAEYTFADPQKEQLLAHTLLPGNGSVSPIGTVLLAYGPDETVRVAGYSADGALLTEKRYRRGDGIVTCDNGRLVFRLDRMEEKGSAPDDPLIGVVSAEATLAKATDGRHRSGLSARTGACRDGALVPL